jgi:hypothetical protein
MLDLIICYLENKSRLYRSLGWLLEWAIYNGYVRQVL